MNAQWHLPGTRPAYTRLEILLGAGGAVEVRHWAGDAAGFLTSADMNVYDLLTEEEAYDVLLALLDGLRLGG